MSLELFAASVLCAASFSLMAYLAMVRKMKRWTGSSRGDGSDTGLPVRRAGDDFDIVSIESKFADLVSELNHAANSHVNAVEDRRDELKRIIASANDRVRKLASLLSDLEIIEKRIRSSIAEERETMVEDLASGQELPSGNSQSRGRDIPASRIPIPASRDLVREAGMSGPMARSGRGSSSGSGSGSGMLRRGAAQSGDVAPGNLRQDIHREIRSQASAGVAPAEIAAGLHVPMNEVEMVLRRKV